LPKINNVQTEIDRLKQTVGSDMESVITNTNSALDLMKSMPKGGLDYTQFTLNYNFPLS